MARCKLNQVNQSLMCCNKCRVYTRRVNPRLVVTCKTKSGGRMGKPVGRRHVQIVAVSQTQYLRWIALFFSFPSPQGTMWLCCCVHEFGTMWLCCCVHEFCTQLQSRGQKIVCYVWYVICGAGQICTVLCRTEGAHALLGEHLCTSRHVGVLQNVTQ